MTCAGLTNKIEIKKKNIINNINNNNNNKNNSNNNNKTLRMITCLFPQALDQTGSTTPFNVFNHC